MPRTQVNFRLGDEQKQRWRDHVEESRYDDTLSDLVKRAVENQIDRDNGEINEGSATESPASGEVLDRIQDLQNEFEDLEAEVSQAVDAVHAQEGMDPDTFPEVYAAIPAGEENAQTAESIAKSGGPFSEEQVRFALQNLVRRKGGDVHRVPEGRPGANEEVRWYKER